MYYCTSVILGGWSWRLINQQISQFVSFGVYHHGA